MTNPADRGVVETLIDDLKAIGVRIEQRLNSHQPHDNSRIHLGNAHIQVNNAVIELTNHLNTLAPPAPADDGEKQSIDHSDVSSLEKAGLADLAGKKA